VDGKLQKFISLSQLFWQVQLAAIG